jgi:hypothetical protein
VKRLVATIVAKATHPEGKLRRWSLYTLLGKERPGSIHIFRDEEYFLWLALHHTNPEVGENAVIHLRRRFHLERVIRESIFVKVRVAALNQLGNEAEALFSELMMHDAHEPVREAAKKRIEQTRQTGTKAPSGRGRMIC